MAGSKSPYGTVKYTSIDEYHAAFEKPVRTMLDKIRKIIRKAAPEAVETISYNIPTFRGNKNLVHYAAFKGHIGFYPGAAVTSIFIKELENYKTSKGGIQFPFGEPIPGELVKKIVEYRILEDSVLSKSRFKKKIT